jgi:hypothetical protein
VARTIFSFSSTVYRFVGKEDRGIRNFQNFLYFNNKAINKEKANPGPGA